MMDVKSRYIEDVLTSEADLLRNRQYKAISEKLRPGSGRLLSGRFYQVKVSGLSGRLSVQHPIYERFVDMRTIHRNGAVVKRKRAQIHNKLIWGTFASIASRLMNGFTDEVASEIRQMFDKAEK